MWSVLLVVMHREKLTWKSASHVIAGCSFCLGGILCWNGSRDIRKMWGTGQGWWLSELFVTTTRFPSVKKWSWCGDLAFIWIFFGKKKIYDNQAAGFCSPLISRDECIPMELKNKNMHAIWIQPNFSSSGFNWPSANPLWRKGLVEKLRDLSSNASKARIPLALPPAHSD